MERFVMKDMEEWYFSQRKTAILIDGARQVGKTYVVREFAKRKIESFVEINLLALTDTQKKLFSVIMTPNQFFTLLSVIYRGELVPGKTVIFLDEVQECINLVTLVKFLVEDGRFRYILSGALLGARYSDVKSMPVGYMEILHMYPMNFTEFCLASGVSESVISNLHECFVSVTKIDDYVDERFSELYKFYLIVGGMPAAVREYHDTQSIDKVIAVQREIFDQYMVDIEKYDKNKPVMSEIFDGIPAELNSQNKRFEFKSLSKTNVHRYRQNPFLWLAEAGVVIPAHSVDELKSPLRVGTSKNFVKLFLSDVGLLTSMYADGIQEKIMMGERDVNFGAIYENAVAVELKSNRLVPYYYNSKKKGELDIVVSIDGEVIPIEIKSGKTYNRYSALNNVLNGDEYDIKKAYVFTNKNDVKRVGKRIWMPIYMSMFLKDKPLGDMIYKINLDGLTK
ncbi:MAG: AAA family ATPase [Clostridia bacterium]|nr:AAA family ATPase [Clostridia bacterium]